MDIWLSKSHFEKLIKESECKSQSAMASFVPKFKKGDKFKRTKKYCDNHNFKSNLCDQVLIATKDSFIENGQERVESAGYGNYWLVTAVEPVPDFIPTFKRGDIVYRTKEYCKKIGLSDYWLSQPIEITENSYVEGDGIEKVWTIDTEVQPITMFTKDKPVPPFMPKIKKGDKIRRTEFQRRTGMDCDEILIAKEDSYLDGQSEKVYDTKYSTYAWIVDKQIELVPFEPTFKKDDVLKKYNYLYLVYSDSYMKNGIEHILLKFNDGSPVEYVVSHISDYALYHLVSK